jgi:hypothetical protein
MMTTGIRGPKLLTLYYWFGNCSRCTGSGSPPQDLEQALYRTTRPVKYSKTSGTFLKGVFVYGNYAIMQKSVLHATHSIRITGT